MPQLKPRLTKTIVISKCLDCPHHMFDYNAGAKRYWGKDACHYGQDLNDDTDGKMELTILADARVIPSTCPLP